MLHERKMKHFKALAKKDNTSAIAEHVKTTGHNITWGHLDILANGKQTIKSTYEIGTFSFIVLIRKQEI